MQFKDRYIRVLSIGFYLFSLSGIPVDAHVNADKPSSSKAPNVTLADDTIVVTLEPGADVKKVNGLIKQVHGTVIHKLHIQKENYWTLMIKPEKGKENETYQKLLSKKDKSIRAVTRNLQLNPLNP